MATEVTNLRQLLGIHVRLGINRLHNLIHMEVTLLKEQMDHITTAEILPDTLLFGAIQLTQM